MKPVKRVVVSVTMVLSVTALVSCDQSSRQMEQNKASIVNANDELFSKGNVEFANQVFAADYAGGGPASIQEFIVARRKAFPDLQVKIDPIIAEGNMVAWLRTNTGTQTGDYIGYKPTSKKITWKEMIFTRYDEQGKVAEEWGVSNLKEVLAAGNVIDGVYEYFPPLKGQGVNRNGRFLYLVGPANGKGPITAQAGTQTFSGDNVTNTVTYSTNPKEIGTSYTWRVKSWSGDTVQYEFINEKGDITGNGKAIRMTK